MSSMKWLLISATIPLLLLSVIYQSREALLPFIKVDHQNKLNQNNEYIIDQITANMRPFDVPIPGSPQSPFPLCAERYCDIVCGFGRGSADLGIPTANVEISDLSVEVNKLDFGVYFGFARLRPIVGKSSAIIQRKDGRDVTYNYGNELNASKGDLDVLPIVLSIGKNPFYGNEYKTVELHILHDFTTNFYGADVKFNILGYIRPELDYTTADALIQDINTDIEIAKRVLKTPEYSKFKEQLIN